MIIAIIAILLILAIFVAQTDQTGLIMGKDGTFADNPMLTGGIIVVFFCWLFLPGNMFGYAAIVGLVLFIAYVMYMNSNSRNSKVVSRINSNLNRTERLRALSEAYIYLAPYNDIWGDLRLVNKYVTIELGADGRKIECKERVHPYRSLLVINPGVHTHEDLWNMFCRYFSHNKSFNGVKEDCEKFRVKYVEKNAMDMVDVDAIRRYDENVANITHNTSQPAKSKEKVDINNCSEIQLTELPGVSIVYAKKVIKKREEIGGFKSVDDFFLFLRLKPHMINQLRELVKVEKMRGYVRKHIEGERSVDF